MINKLQPILNTLAAVCMIVASGVLVWAMLTARPGSTADGPGTTRGSIAENVEDRRLDLTILGDLGKQYPYGQLILIEFSDFQCPFCARHALETSRQLTREFASSRKVEHLFLNFPLESIHQFAFKAGEAAECARSQGKLWEMYYVLFENQTALGTNDLYRYARRINLDMSLFTECLEGKTAAKIRQDMAEGQRLGVFSTPTFLIGRVGKESKIRILRMIRGAAPHAIFESVIRELVTQSAPRL